MSEKVLIHIGYHKTASTWFQQEIFLKQDLGFSFCKQKRHFIHKAFCETNLYDFRPNKFMDQIVNEANEATANGKVFVLSHERLSGYPASGGYDSEKIANLLHRHFPNASILCFIREQTSMIFSVWRQQIIDGGGLSLKRFINPPEQQIVRLPLFNQNMYKYTRLHKHYKDLFTKERVLCIPYEQFCRDSEGVILQMGSFLKNPILLEQAHNLTKTSQVQNKSLSMPMLGMLMFLNILFTRNQLSQHCLFNIGSRRLRWLARAINRYGGSFIFKPIDAVLQKKAKQKIEATTKSVYQKDNSELEKTLGISLSVYGYNV